MNRKHALTFMAAWAGGSIAVIVFDGVRSQPINWEVIIGMGAGFIFASLWGLVRQ
jgi:hypothetical protein